VAAKPEFHALCGPVALHARAEIQCQPAPPTRKGAGHIETDEMDPAPLGTFETALEADPQEFGVARGVEARWIEPAGHAINSSL
jgi:hypothetical protein